MIANHLQQAQLARALSNPERLRLLELLLQAPRSVEDLTHILALPLRTVSHHLQRLKAAQLVEDERRGRRKIYRLTTPRSMARMLVSLRRVAEAHLYTASTPSEHTQERWLSLAGLSQLQAHSNPLIVDVRPVPEYTAGHMEGAVNAPAEDLVRQDTLPVDRTIVIYCRGASCGLAEPVIEHLRERGAEVLRLDAGLADLYARPDPRVITGPNPNKGAQA